MSNHGLVDLQAALGLNDLWADRAPPVGTDFTPRRRKRVAHLLGTALALFVSVTPFRSFQNVITWNNDIENKPGLILEDRTALAKRTSKLALNFFESRFNRVPSLNGKVQLDVGVTESYAAIVQIEPIDAAEKIFQPNEGRLTRQGEELVRTLAAATKELMDRRSSEVQIGLFTDKIESIESDRDLIVARFKALQTIFTDAGVSVDNRIIVGMPNYPAKSQKNDRGLILKID